MLTTGVREQALGGIRPALGGDKPNTASTFEKSFSEALSDISSQPGGAFMKQDGYPEDTAMAKLSVPNWVLPEFKYDPENPRKPNMKELMQAISGQSLEQLLSDRNSNWREVANLSSELLHGVVGSNQDTRDWHKISADADIVSSIRSETNKLYDPQLRIQSEKDASGTIVQQYATINDRDGKILRTISGSPSKIYETLKNFGVTAQSVNLKIQSETITEKFHKTVLDTLTAYGSGLEYSDRIANVEISQ